MSALSLSGQVLLPGGTFAEATVHAADGVVVSVNPGAAAQADLRTAGWIIPGLVDLQVNGGFGLDVTADPTSALALAERLPQTGVTAFLPTIISSPITNYRPSLQVLDKLTGETRGATILGVHVEGPYLNPRRAGAHNPAFLCPPSIAQFDEALAASCVRLVTLAPELPGALELAAHLNASGIVVSAGHSDATYEQAQAGFQAGITLGTHLFNAMSPFTHRAPGLAGALLASDVPCGLIADGVHSHPASVATAWRAKGARGIVLVTDAMGAMGMPPGSYVLGDRAVTVDATSARLADGTLAGSILTLDAAIRNLVEFAGASLADAAMAASATPARVLGLKRGAIAPGYAADFVLLDPSRRVEKTIVGGRVVYERG